MKPLRYDQPVTGDALLLGARLPRRDEVPRQPLAPVETSPGVFLAADGKFFTNLETPKGVSPEVRMKSPYAHQERVRRWLLAELARRSFEHEFVLSDSVARRLSSTSSGDLHNLPKQVP